MVKAKKYVVTKRFAGIPNKSDFEIVEHELPPLKNDEVLLKTEWISVDPYLRSQNAGRDLPYDQFGYQVAVVIESKASDYPVGSRVVSHNGWCDYSILNTKATPKNAPDVYYKLPDLKGLPNSLAVGAVGMPGAAAYFGFLELCKPKPGETVVVTGAAGAVGIIVGQIAKLIGCKVIGFAGSDEKAAWLEKEIGFDKALNYKTIHLPTALKEVAPNGVDCYFDNVGGEMSSIIIGQMNQKGRVGVCGCISAYEKRDDLTVLPKATILQTTILIKELRMTGLIVWRWLDRWPEAFEYLAKHIKDGDIKAHEHISEGFDNIVEAFIGMLTGANFGKAVIKV